MKNSAPIGSGPGQVFGLAGQVAFELLLLTPLPIPVRTVMRGCSFLLTAAGQSRILTGFPFQQASSIELARTASAF
jgi:hypothetical protein